MGLLETSASVSDDAKSSSTAAVGGNLLGSGATVAANLLGTWYATRKAKELYDYQTDYKKLMNKMISAGISPAAAAQGLSGSTPSMVNPSVPSAPDLSNLGSAGVAASAVPSEIQGRVAEAEYHNQQKEEVAQRMLFNPSIWRSQIATTWSEYSKNLSMTKYYGSLKGYYDEMKENLVQFRPWELSKLQKSLDVMDSEISKNYSLGRESDTHSFFMNQQAFEQMWRNQLLSAGVNPSQPLWESIKRICLLDPSKGKVFLDNATTLVRLLDNKAKENLGEHYKRNALLIGGLHWLNDRIGHHKTAKTERFRNFMQGVSSVIPFAGGFGKSGVGRSYYSSPRDDWFDYYTQ